MSVTGRSASVEAMPPSRHHALAAAPTVLLLEGGGALGAYMAGVWRVLAPHLGAAPMAIAGSSIGALNAAIIARHVTDDDLGVGALDAFWRDEIATCSTVFSGGWGRDSHRLDGMLTGLLVGNRALHRAEPLNWHPAAEFVRARHPLASRGRLQALLERRIGRIRGHEPWVGAVAVDVMAGALTLFDSDTGGVGAPELLASSAIPIVYAPVEIGGRLYWDGDMTRESMLHPVLQRLHHLGRLQRGQVPRLITVSLRSRRADVPPVSGAQLSWRMLDLLMHGKLGHGEARAAGVPEAIVLERGPLPGDELSREFDYSPRRIDELIAQGVREASLSLEGVALAATC